MTSSSSKSCPSCAQGYDADVLFCPQDGTPLANLRGAAISNADIDLYVGLELAGHIRIKHLIGIGSMGRVYRAFQGGIERDVAVKILHRELSGNAELVGRFHREAKIASRLSHPNVVSVLMAGSIPQKGDPRVGGEMYLVMEHLDGMSLLSALAAAGTGGVPSALPLSRALHIVIQVCEAVGEAHAQGIVHRDIKPENVMLIRRGDDRDFVKVLDFGIARLDWTDGSMATQAGLIFGTARYISPEGAEGKPVTPAADVYSIATMLYQCLAGRTPFEGDSPVQILVQHTHAPAPDLRTIPRASYVPVPIADVIMRNLSKKPDERARDARAFGKDLFAAVRESGLDPDEVFHAGLLSARQGAVKLPSKERTKSLDLSPELAARIGGIPARTAESTPLPASSEPTSAAEPTALEAQATSVDPSKAGLSADATPETQSPSSKDVEPPHEATPSVRPAEPDLEAAAKTETALHSPASPELTMQGTEKPFGEHAEHARDEKRRSRLTRIVAVALCIVVVPFVAVIGGKRFGLVATSSDDSLPERLEAARDAMKRQAWDAPADDNVRDILDKALAKWPGDARVLELRREAAERLVTSALGRKYAGDPAEALHLARVAVSLHPSLTTAQHLVAELEGKPLPNASPLPSAAMPPAPSATSSTADPKNDMNRRPSQASGGGP
ncbi:MAG: protein kinase [Polyangiaceae bacterium]|nr:protein kinase [Polyangiaceae bacterium]